MNNEFLRRNANNRINLINRQYPQHHQTHVPTIMDSNREELLSIIFDWIRILDDWQQLSGGDPVFSEAFNTIEKSYYQVINPKVQITPELRNNIRLSCKYAAKQAALYTSEIYLN